MIFVVSFRNDPFPSIALIITVVACCPWNSDGSMASTPGLVNRGWAVRVNRKNCVLYLEPCGYSSALICPCGKVARLASKISMFENANALECVS